MNYEKILFYVVVLLFVFSLGLPAANMGNGSMGFEFGDEGASLGMGYLVWGWLGLLGGCGAWLSNILGPLAFFAMYKKFWNKGAGLSFLAIALGLTSYQVVEKFFVGFYVWELSFVLTFIFCALKIKKEDLW